MGLFWVYLYISCTCEVCHLDRSLTKTKRVVTIVFYYNLLYYYKFLDDMMRQGSFLILDDFIDN